MNNIKILRFLFCLGNIFLLTRCAPQYPVQGIERSSKAYYVQGSWHYPQHHYSYNKVGLASWYGPRFHGSKKAQGEVYDQYAMTAAHKTLPLPTIAKVTNLENGKSVVVLVDDRGPFKYKNRIIDLSVSAAKELGMYNKGLGRVRVQALPKESHALSIYLKNYGNRAGKDYKNRSWERVYREEIGCRSGYQNLTKICPKVQELNRQEIKSKKVKRKNQKISNMTSYIRSRTSQ